MCFYNDDYDWTAMVSDVTDKPSGEPTACFECGASIAADGFRRHIFQQEHEECQRCEWEELDDDDEPCTAHDYGETFSCDICESCTKVLQAIEAVEIDEGCPEYARQPAYGELREELYQGDGVKYRNRALLMFPELSACEWLSDVARHHASALHH